MSHNRNVIICGVLGLSLIAVLAFFHLFTLIGIWFLGVVAYVADYSIGKRREDGKGLFVYNQDMMRRAKFVFFTVLAWFIAGFIFGKNGFSGLMELPAQMFAFFIGVLLGPLGLYVWERRREMMQKADRLEKGIKEGTIDPLAVTRDAAVRVGSTLAGVAEQVLNTVAPSDSTQQKNEPAKSAPPATVAAPAPVASATPPAPPTPQERPDDVIGRYLRGERDTNEPVKH